PCDLIWGMAGDSRLRRRVSALSQCSTTERRWLMASESSVTAGDSSRRQSRVVSPTLTARSSMSDMNGPDPIAPRMLSIDRALAKSALLLSQPAIDSAETHSQVGSSGPASLGSTSRTSSAGRSEYEPIVAAVTSAASDAQDVQLLPPTPVSAIPRKADSFMESDSGKQLTNQAQQEPVDQTSVFSPAKNPYARPKNYQRSRPSLSLFASKQVSASEPKQAAQPATPAAADTNRRPFSRNGEEEDEQSKDAEEGTAAAAAPITPITPTAFVAESPLRSSAAKVRQVSATPSIGSGSPSRIPRPPSSVSRIDRTSQQADSASVTSLMATLTISSDNSSGMSAKLFSSTAGDSEYAGQQPLTLDEFTAALNNM
ncbi:hypothetical protein FBU31_007613, partial [Coemansia sp. 'formosensis']